MAFFRFNRDPRGYEHFYLVEPVTNRRGKTRPRVLYWYRTPPNVRVGRAPFDEEVRRALEAQNPNVTFDWKKIAEAPIPSADVEKWRERRRLEKAEKARLRSAASPGVSDLDESMEEAATAAEAVFPAEESEPAVNAHAVVSASSAAIRKRRRRRRGRGRVDAAITSKPTSAGDVSSHDADAAPRDAAPDGSGD
jgi:hypothetical protein